MTRSEKRNRNRINKTQRGAEILGGRFRICHNEVPHIVVDLGDGHQASVCFFGRNRTWKVFFPYGESKEKQIQVSLSEISQVQEQLNQLRKKVACDT